MTFADLSEPEPEWRPAMEASADVEAFKAHPRYADAARSSAACSIELYDSGRLVSWILGDRARALFGFVIMYLHVTRDPDDPRSGITATRVKDFCVARQLCSPGRAGAMLALMQTAGYLAYASGIEDRRVRRLEPTPKLLALQRDRVATQFEATLEVMPEAGTVLANLHRPEFQAALARGLAERFIGGYRILHYARPIELFAERSAGVVILYGLMLAGGPEAGFPPDRPVELSVAPLSRRFGVSRIHILRLLRDAEAQGLLERLGPDGGWIHFKPVLTEAMRDFVAAAFVLLRDGARKALAEAGEQ